MLLLFDCISPDMCAEVMLTMLDARDLIRLFDEVLMMSATHPTPPTAAAFFCAARVLLRSELDWFAARGIAVKLHHSMVTDTVGNKFWFENGNVPHRDGDLPAVEYSDGRHISWYKNDLLHRNGDQPADIYVNIRQTKRTQKWYFWGKLYRTVTEDVV